MRIPTLLFVLPSLLVACEGSDLDSLNTEMADATIRLDELEAEDVSTVQDVVELQGRVAALEAELTSLTGLDLTDLLADVADNKARLDTIEADYATDAEVAAVQTGVDANGTAIETNATDIATQTAGVAANAAAASSNAFSISTNTTDITTNASGVAANASGVSANAASIATNASGVSTNASGVSTNATGIAGNTSAIDANTTSIGTQATGIAANTASIGTNASGIAANTASIGTNASGIASNASSIGTNASGIASNSSSIGTNATAISGNAFDIADVTSRVEETEAYQIVHVADLTGIAIDGRDDGFVTGYTLDFTKTYAGSDLYVYYLDNLRVNGTNTSCSWELRIDDVACPSGVIQSASYAGVYQNRHIAMPVAGVCSGISEGAHTLRVYVSSSPGYTGADCYTGWNHPSPLLLAREIRP